MTPPNLTHIDAKRRAALLTVVDYAVEIDLTDGSGAPGEATYATTTTVRFACREPGARCWIDFVGPGVRSAVLNGSELDVSGYREDEGIALPELAADNELTVLATGGYTNTGQGLHRFVDPVDGSVYLYTQFETADAKRLFACFDQPDLKARYTLTVHAPRDWQVVSNTVAERITEGPGGAVTHQFAPSEIMSTYLVALMAGPYAHWHDEYIDERADGWGEHSAGHLLPRFAGSAHGRRPAVHRDQAGLRLLPHALRDSVPVRQVRPAVRSRVQRRRDGERRRGDVPRGLCLPLPGHPRALRAARRDRAARDGAHVVRRPGDHALVGRPVAERVVRHLGERRSARPRPPSTPQAWTTFANIEKTWAYRQDQLPSTHPIAADMPDVEAVEVNFDGITYAKGASVLKQLVAYVGREPFLAGLRAYFTAHAWGNATFDDLLAALEEASGRDLSDWGAQWLETTGLNTAASVVRASTPTAGSRAFEVVQGGARPGPGELRTHRIAVGIYDDDATAGSCAPTASRSTSPASAPRCRRWSECRAAGWCWSTTTT